MNYHLSRKVKEKIDLYLSLLKTKRKGIEGFLIGDLTGNIPIIEDIFFIQFDKNSLDQIYPEVLQTYGKRILGPIFIGKKKFESEWFLEDIILEF